MPEVFAKLIQTFWLVTSSKIFYNFLHSKDSYQNYNKCREIEWHEKNVMKIILGKGKRRQKLKTRMPDNVHGCNKK